MNPPVSDAKLAANRANAEKSTGPRTPAGKESSSMNRLSHGLASPLTVLAFENQADYDALLDSFVREFMPTTPSQRTIVRQIAGSQWKLRRIEAIETAVFNAMIGTSPNEPTGVDAIAASLLKSSNPQSVLSLLARYQTTLTRQFLTGIKELRKFQKEYRREKDEAIQSSVTSYLNTGRPTEGMDPLDMDDDTARELIRARIRWHRERRENAQEDAA